MNIGARAQSVLDKIDGDELVKVALDLANIDSPTGAEGPVGDYVYDWLTREGFAARKIALMPDRPNVLGTLPGTRHGRSLVFNSHMDTTIHKDEWWTTRRAADPVFHSAWREGDVLVGNGICNDKGPMATWLLAAKAIKDSGEKLKGDLLLMVGAAVACVPVFLSGRRITRLEGGTFVAAYLVYLTWLLVARA